MMIALFVILSLLSLILFYYGTYKDKRVLLVFSLWMSFTGYLSVVGFFKNTSALPPRFLLVLLPASIIVVYLYKALNNKPVKINFLLAIHALRLPVELFLYQLYLQKKVPVLMTFHGWNMDVFSGISALVLLSYILLTGKSLNCLLFKIWNIVGLTLLAIIVTTAILSAPLPIQQLAFDQPNVAVMEFPFIFLPAVIVPLVLLSHLLGLRSFKADKS